MSLLYKSANFHRIGRIGLQKRFISLKPDFSKYKIIEQPAGYIVGTVNDAYQQPTVDHYHGSYHWAYEKIVALGMVPLVMSPFVIGVEYPFLDALFSGLLLIHCHAGFMSCIIDYIPERVYGAWHKVAARLLTLGTFVGFYGVYELETDSNGLFNLVKSLWNA